MKPVVTICADIGSVAKGNFGWWSSRGERGTRPSELSDHVQTLLDEGFPVALGFECPLFVPLVEDEFRLTSARPGEGSRAWSAGAGCGALATGLVQVTWVLQEIRKNTAQPHCAFLSWHDFCTAKSGLFVWEAFVTGTAKGASHIVDAQLGATAFMQSLPDPTQSSAVRCNSGDYSLIGASLLRTGWSTDLRMLQEQCVVIRAGVA